MCVFRIFNAHCFLFLDQNVTVAKKIINFLQSYHATRATTLAIDALDPSLALAFFCRDRAGRVALLDALVAPAVARDALEAPVVGVVASAPRYATNIDRDNDKDDDDDDDDDKDDLFTARSSTSDNDDIVFVEGNEFQFL